MNNKWHILFIVDEIKCTHSNILSIEQLFSLYTYNSCSLVGKFLYGTRLFFGENAFTVPRYKQGRNFYFINDKTI